MRETFNPKAVAKPRSKPSAGPSKFPRYVAIGNSKAKPAATLDVCDSIGEHVRGRVMLDFDADGELIGVEIIG